MQKSPILNCHFQEPRHRVELQLAMLSHHNIKNYILRIIIILNPSLTEMEEKFDLAVQSMIYIKFNVFILEPTLVFLQCIR